MVSVAVGGFVADGDSRGPVLAVFSGAWNEAATDVSSKSARGWTSHTVSIHPHLVVAEPKQVGAALRFPAVEYRWPGIVLERHRWLRRGDLLVEHDGHIARLALTARIEEVRAALTAAEFEVCEVEHYGWGEPLSLPRSEIAGFADKLPRCLIAPYDHR